MRAYQLKQVTAPAAEPLLIGGAKRELDLLQHLRIDSPDEKEAGYLKSLVGAARRYAENVTGRFFIEQTWDLLIPPGCVLSSGSNFLLGPEEIRIPRAPIKAAGGIVHVKYLDRNGDQQTLSSGTDYISVTRGDLGIVAPAYGKCWPSIRWWIDASGNFPMEVRFIAGYGADGTTVPETFRQAMLLLIGHWYENREEVTEGLVTQLPTAAEALLMQDRFSAW